MSPLPLSVLAAIWWARVWHAVFEFFHEPADDGDSFADMLAEDWTDVRWMRGHLYRDRWPGRIHDPRCICMSETTGAVA